MQDKHKQEESDRAFRIAEMTDECHLLVTKIYESLVDREFVSAEKEMKLLISDIRLMIKSIPDDVF